jgi:hypothetical protein
MNPQLSTEEQENLMEIFKSKNVIYTHYLPDIDNDVKHDTDVKLSTFYVAISSFLKSPLNETVKGESGVGKTFGIKQVLSYFPQDKIHYIGSESPTAFYHDNGVLMNKEGKPINLDDEPIKPIKKAFPNPDDFEAAKATYLKAKKEWNKVINESYLEIDLSHRIMFFLDVESEGFKKLLPVLSHDNETIEFNFTDKGTNGLKTKKVRTKGFPCAIFAMTERDMGKRENERATRQAFCVSPEDTEEKVRDANKAKAQEIKWEIKRERPTKTKLRELLRSIRDIFISEKYEVQIPFLNLNELYPNSEIRNMRGFCQFKDAIEANTALHIHQRVIVEFDGTKYVLSSIQDVEMIVDLFSKLYESTGSNMDASLLKFYWDYCILFISDGTLFVDGFTVNDMLDRYNTVNKKKIPRTSMNTKLNLLYKKGYLDKCRDSFNNKQFRYIPLKTKKEELTPTNNTNYEIVLSTRLLLETGLKIFFNHVTVDSKFYILKKDGTDQFEEIEISRQEAEEIILCKNTLLKS